MRMPGAKLPFIRSPFPPHPQPTGHRRSLPRRLFKFRISDLNFNIDTLPFNSGIVDMIPLPHTLLTLGLMLLLSASALPDPTIQGLRRTEVVRRTDADGKLMSTMMNVVWWRGLGRGL